MPSRFGAEARNVASRRVDLYVAPPRVVLYVASPRAARCLRVPASFGSARRAAISAHDSRVSVATCWPIDWCTAAALRRTHSPVRTKPDTRVHAYHGTQRSAGRARSAARRTARSNFLPSGCTMRSSRSSTPPVWPCTPTSVAQANKQTNKQTNGQPGSERGSGWRCSRQAGHTPSTRAAYTRTHARTHARTARGRAAQRSAAAGSSGAYGVAHPRRRRTATGACR